MAQRRTAAVASAALAVALTAGCSPRGSAPPAGLGRAVHSGPVRALVPSPDGAELAFLDGCQEVKVQFLPPQTARCDLRLVPSAGGAATKVAAGVTTLPQGVAWRGVLVYDGGKVVGVDAPHGNALAAMADYDHAGASATLVLWEGGAARTLASGVTFHGFGHRGELAWVSAGKLSVLPPGEKPREVPGADAVATFEFVPGANVCQPMNREPPSSSMVARRAATSGGGLFAVDCFSYAAKPLEAGQVGDYRFSAELTPHLAYAVQRGDGAELKARWTAGLLGRPEATLGQRVGSFAFSGSALAYVADVAPGKQGNLYVARLRSYGPPLEAALLAREVGEFRWAQRSPRLAWLERYDPRVRAGRLGVGGPGLAARTLASNVSEFELSPDGQHVAFLQHTTRGGYSVDLGLAHVDPAAASTTAAVATGAFGFAFSPDGAWLYYRTRCVRNAEACDLERIPAGGLAPGAKPERIADAVKSFEFDPRDPGRLLVGWQRADLVALDVGVWEKGKLTRVDSAVLPGSARFLGPDSRRLAYVVIHPKRQGVYVAELPR